MPTAQRRAQVVWEGNLAKGSGRLTVGSGAFPEQGITFASRTEQPDGKTSPEELIAAAHAGCYAMALSFGLSQAGTPPTRLSVSAVCTLDRADGGFRITTMELEVEGQVPGIDQAQFEQAAQQAKEGCPVSQALHNNVDIRLKTRLAGA
jgi:osmotically inducible protein OsmC